jgi:hypothetical protein
MKVTFWKRYGVDAGDAAWQVNDTHSDNANDREAAHRKRSFLIG